jgi:anti-sigma28 factor (negative regulator of flagellin synthesis)
MRKLVQKDEPREKDASVGNRGANAAAGSDAVQISSAARNRAKLRAASDYREEKVRSVRERLEDGTLVTPESLRSGTRKMLDSLFSGEL